MRAWIMVLFFLAAPVAAQQYLTVGPGPVPSLPLSGGTVTGTITLNGLPAGNLIGAAPQGYTLVGTRTGWPTYPQNGYGLNQASMSRAVVLFPAGASSISLCYYGGGRASGGTPVSTWALGGVTSTGGTLYAVNDTVVLAATAANRASTLRVTQVAAGVPTKWTIDDPGWYYTQLPDATAQASTSGTGTGATFTFTWSGYAYGVTASIEPVWGTQTLSGTNALIPVTYNLGRALGTTIYNNLDIMVPPSQIVCSDPVAANIPVGGQVGVRQYARGVSMGMRGGVAIVAGAAVSDGWSLVTDGSTNPSNTQLAPATNLITNNSGFINSSFVEPLMILGRPKVAKPTLCFVGDSISVGANGSVPATNGIGTDAGDTNAFRGWMERSTLGAYPFTNFGVGGDAYTTTFATIGQFQAEINAIARSGCSTVVIELSVNDISLQKTAAQILAYEQQFIQGLRAIPTVRKIIGSTTVPYTLGCSDINAGTGCGGTRAGYCTNLNLRNTDLRNGLLASGKYAAGAGSSYASLFDAVIDFGATIENPTGSCLWQAGAIGDGLHPSTAGHILMATTANAILVGNAQ